MASARRRQFAAAEGAGLASLFDTGNGPGGAIGARAHALLAAPGLQIAKTPAGNEFFPDLPHRAPLSPPSAVVKTLRRSPDFPGVGCVGVAAGSAGSRRRSGEIEIMSAFSGSRRSAALLAAVLLMGFGLSACGGLDDMLFGGGNEQPSSAQSNQNQANEGLAPAPDQQIVGENGNAEGGMQAYLPPQRPSAAAPGMTITPIGIQPGANTGTAVSTQVAGLRSDLIALQNHVVMSARRLADLRAMAEKSAGYYHDAKARITTRLQMGTTRGNPDLVKEWNVGQAALDALTSNINALNALGTDIANDSSKAHFELDTIQATFNVSGAVDEDHRQLSVLEDETGQIIVLIDRLLKEVSDDVQRQTTYVANERANLTTLASAIKNGELYGADLGSTMLAAGTPSAVGAVGGTPLVTIKFDHPDVQYQQILYTAVSQALQSRPGAAFDIVAVSPTRGSLSAVQMAQTNAQRHAQEVLRTMTDMGVPASRLGISSSTDPTITASEVRVFVH
jgi:hypothetical protein